MRELSVCILTCGQVESTKRLIRSFGSFIGLDFEIVIGDNSADAAAQETFRVLGDTYLTISDYNLWHDGFGACKQRIVTAASNPWVIIADPDEEWFPVTDGHKWNHDVLFSTKSPVFRTKLSGDRLKPVYHGRVFNRRQMRLMGLIHEEPYHRRSRKSWGDIAPQDQFANILHLSHEKKQEDSRYQQRKTVLYDELLNRIAEHEELRAGTNPWWWTEYWPQRKKDWKSVSFEEWKEM